MLTPTERWHRNHESSTLERPVEVMKFTLYYDGGFPSAANDPRTIADLGQYRTGIVLMASGTGKCFCLSAPHLAKSACSTFPPSLVEIAYCSDLLRRFDSKLKAPHFGHPSPGQRSRRFSNAETRRSRSSACVISCSIRLMR